MSKLSVCSGTDETAVLVARGVRGQHALTYRAPNPWHEYSPALHEGRAGIVCNFA